MNFENLWKTYERELSTYVLSRVRDKEIQREIMQEVALKIFTSLHLQKEHLRGWLYSITKNIIVDYYRKATKPIPELEEETEVSIHILSACLKPMLNKLKKNEKEILELTQIREYSLKEVARKKKLPLNTVKSTLYRAKKSLASQFFSCCKYEYDRYGNVVHFDSDCSC